MVRYRKMSERSRDKLITFLSGTRADFGKMLPLIRRVEALPGFTAEVVATGMHMLEYYGYTIHEIQKAGIKNVFPMFNQDSSTSEKMDIVLANTIIQMSHYLNERHPDLLVVHGDRVETLAGAIAGSLNNIRVGHFEGGEVSGTIDESLRHAISKMSHVHFTANQQTKNRLLQLGEREASIFVIGSPEIDMILSSNLPPLDIVRDWYNINYTDYAVFIYHPVTTEVDRTDRHISEVIAGLTRTGHSYVAIKPNNDIGSDIINAHVNRFAANDNVRLFPSVRFECFLTLLKNAKYIVGNSSAGVREAPVFGVPCVNIGSRQRNRNKNAGIFNVEEDADEIYETIMNLPKQVDPVRPFGDGQTAAHFAKVLNDKRIWSIPIQKTFVDLRWPTA